MIIGVDGAHRADVGLVARGARRALVQVDVEDAVAEHRDGVRVRRVRVLDLARSSFLLGEELVLVRVELVDALNGTHVDARSVLRVDARLGDDGNTSHAVPPCGSTGIYSYPATQLVDRRKAGRW